MDKFPVLQNELARLEKLYSYDILGMEPEDRFDDLTKLAASILDVPICLITLMDADWQAFISNVGTDMKGNQRGLSFCKYCVVQEEILEVQDTLKDARFAQNPLVLEAPHLRYYVGAPLIDEEGFIIGTVCGYDLKPREMSDFQKVALKQITSTVMRLIHLRKVDLDQKKYKSIFNLSQDLLGILSKDGRIKEFNPAIGHALNVSDDELSSQPLSNWVHPDDLPIFNQLFDEQVESQIRTEIIFRLRKASNEYITTKWSYYFDHELSIVVISGHDISLSLSYQKDLEDAVIRANEAVEMKDQFLSDMSHEIRTPVASIVGFSELLQTSDLNAEQKTYSEAISIASEHLINIVNDVLDVYKFAKHEIALDPVPENLESVLVKVKKLYNLKAASKNIQLHLNIDGEIPKSLNIDRTRLTQILSNLISNAIKFTSVGAVTISAKLVSRKNKTCSILFSVIDTGIGIEPEHQKAIFNRFTQANDATWKLYGGTGLGLSIAKFLVERHHSQLKCESIPNQGTTFNFEVEFTVSDLKHSILMNNPFEKSEIPSLNGLKILLAEDNLHLQILYKTFIERNGGIIYLVSNGQEALDFLKGNQVDLILLDIQMPILNGYEVARIMRESLALTCPIIGCSANLIHTKSNGKEYAFLDDFMSKPLTEMSLIVGILKHHYAKTVESEHKTDDFVAILNQLSMDEGEELVTQFKSIFKSRIPTDINEIREALATENTEKIKEKSHFLSTTLLTLKFKTGLKITGDIDAAIDENRNKEAFSLAERLVNYLEHALTIL